MKVLGLTAGLAALAAAAGGAGPALAQVLVALIAVVAAGQLLGRLLRAVGQPPVIGEVVAGILLGPSLLGRVWPEAAAAVLPPQAAPYLGVLAQLGVILYMFIVGLEFNPQALGRRARAAVVISQAGIVVPLALGAALAPLVYPRLAGPSVSPASFALFCGVALSVTAFPVLARILTDRRMHQTPLGVLALGCAAAGDVTAWCLLALAAGAARAEVGGALVVMGLTAAYVAFMLLAVRPVAARLVRRHGNAPLTPGVTAVVLVALLASALATEWIGIHALFGAFLFGAIVPHDSGVARAFAHKLEDFVTVLLLPAFFALTGLRTEIGLVQGAGEWLVCGLILLVATLGKFGGTLAAARLAGLSWRDGASLGVLMNTRGLMELIVLNVGLDLGVISPTLFAMLVVMALATTLTTAPALRLLAPYDEPRPAPPGDVSLPLAGKEV